jgi:glycosyl hydrolase family 92
VWSALGLYPVTPGSPDYVLGTPLFPRATVHLPNGRTFTVRGYGVSSKFPYIQRAALNGRPLDRTWIDHDTLLRGGELMVETGPRPERAWATGPHAAPRSRLDGPSIVPLPFVARGDRVFQDRTLVVLQPVEEGDVVWVSVDNGRTFQPYEDPIPLTETTTLQAYCARGNEESARIQVEFRKMSHRAKITLRTRYANEYAAGGDRALVDRERGGRNHRTGGWQGYQGVNLHAVVDLGETQPLRRLAAGFLQDQRAWIWMPLRVRFAVSGDGKTFAPVGGVVSGVDAQTGGTIVKEFSLDLPPGTHARYVEVVAENRGTCPAGHPGAGQPAWIFADEIVWE